MLTNYQKHLKLLLQLHQLTIEGKENTVEHDEICEQVDDAYYVLSEAEHGKLNELSVALYAISDEVLQEKKHGSVPTA